jgi:hypothetical protein
LEFRLVDLKLKKIQNKQTVFWYESAYRRRREIRADALPGGEMDYNIILHTEQGCLT